MATASIQKRLSRSRSMGRRVSGIWLFKSSRTPAPIPESSMVLPTELFREIASHLTKPEILVLSSCSSELRSLLLPDIYAAVSGFCGGRACSAKLGMLSTAPKLWVYIRKLEIGPDWFSWPIEESVELRTASTIEKIFPGLTNLDTFTWCSIYPLQETVWRALRMSCLKLINLSYTAQIRQFQPDSELFKFRNLRQFSLCVKEKAEAPPLIQLNLPPQLCDMLLQNLDLEHLDLRLCPSHNNLQSLSRLMQGTWRNLWSFHIDICAHHPARNNIASFLASHPRIRSLSIVPHLRHIPPLLLDHDTLPRLESFTGISQHVSALSNVDCLQSLSLGDESLSDPSFVLAALRRLTFLTSLTINIADANSMSTLSGIVSACSNLESLSISYLSPCSTKQWKAIAVELRRIPSLWNLTLTKTYRLADGPMLAAALILLEHNPGLREIHIVWVSMKAWKQSGDYIISSRTGQDDTRVPDSVDAKEFGPRALGGSFTRRFRYTFDDGDKVSKGLARIWW
ncbi:hypothetical protein B0H12DRAFT_375209 [Mycena haematopus]|nr:hypothetical protein B0H12DRAFT_375209 [Mycena haematopus]